MNTTLSLLVWAGIVLFPSHLDSSIRSSRGATQIDLAGAEETSRINRAGAGMCFALFICIMQGVVMTG
jgi:hypothetical protein